MKLTVVGCSGSYPGPDSAASCYLVEAEHDDGTGNRTWRVLMDLGNGALGPLHRYADPLSIDAVLLSHLHADHCLDLCGYYVLRKYHPTGHQPRIPVYGPAHTAERMARAYDLQADPGMGEEFEFRTWSSGSAVTIGPFTVIPTTVVHPVEAYALRVHAGGAVLAYTGDSGPCEALTEVAREADLLLAEASFHHELDNPPDLHLTGLDCGELARSAEVGQLVLTHVPPWFDPTDMLAAAATVWTGKSALAQAGSVYEIGAH